MAVGQTSQSKIPPPSGSDKSPISNRKTGNIVGEVLYELKHTTWPTFPEAWRLTMVVLAVIVSMAIYMGIIDFVLSTLTKTFHLIK